ncbi:glycoside hydrolase family 10 protein [Solitalea lacus]|uniref:glycoside hydrolase family 10 protein n=1 Tax=Solitalea lacus TaxID=2911172 RepID=UPI001EDAB899|nr:family 10 glycosylhydrolase [Solitalea lacus]UKJ08003.1 family 10 glycosylhydrolase [Solitalea lacus]
MTNTPSRIVITLIFLLYLLPVKAQNNLPPKRELRGVWIATVANIDWPSSKQLSATEQQDEFKYILDQHKRTGINAIFGQVRPAADAFYAKSREPWSFWLTGQQGRAPFPLYDPLEFMIEESHKRGMEFHAWFNPYRATHTSGKGIVAPSHITKKKPEWFFNYAGQLLFNPGIPEVREYIVSVIMDVVRNYDIDGIHFDDYFYPYPEPGQYIPDWNTFKKYSNGFTTIEDWRRNNVNLLIKMVNDSIKATKPYVKFGISPFGIWKNSYQDEEGSDTRGGASYYNQFADSRKWIEEGWVDYMLPQIYFNTGHPKADFETLTDWWANNAFGRHIYIGMGAYRIGSDPAWRKPNHMPEQIKYTRSFEDVYGQVYFSSKSLTRNIQGFTDTLRNNYYRYAALLPTMHWIDSIPPNAPQNIIAEQTNPGVVKISWEEPLPASDGDKARGYVIYRVSQTETFDINDPRKIIGIVYNQTQFVDTEPKTKQTYTYVVSSIDRMQNESTDYCVITIPVN